MLRINPAFTTEDGRYGRLPYAEEAREIDLARLERIKGAKRSSLVEGKAGEAVPFAARVGLNAATFGKAIVDIVLLGAQEKMADPIDAPAYIATVKNLHTLWHRAVVEFPGDNVRAFIPRSASAVSDLSVSARRHARGPEPAFLIGASSDFFQETLSQSTHAPSLA